MAVQPLVPDGQSSDPVADEPLPDEPVESLVVGNSLVVCPSTPGPVTVSTPESPVVAVVSTGRPPVVPVVSGSNPLVSVGRVPIASPGRLESVLVVGIAVVGTVMTGAVLTMGTGTAPGPPSSLDAT